MVEIGSGPIKESIDNTVFIVPGIIIGFLVGKYLRLFGRNIATSAAPSKFRLANCDVLLYSELKLGK